MNIITKTVLNFTKLHFNRTSPMSYLKQLETYAKKGCDDKDFFNSDNDDNWTDLVYAFDQWLLINHGVVHCAEWGGVLNPLKEEFCDYCGFACDNFLWGGILLDWLKSGIVRCTTCDKSVSIQKPITLCPHCGDDCNGFFIFASRGVKK